MQRLVKEGLKVVFDKDKAIIEKHSIALACGKRLNNMLIEFQVLNKVQANMYADINTWHERLEHVGYNNLLKLPRNNMVNNLKPKQW